MQKGFSFVEIIISVSVGSIVLVTLFALASQNLTTAELTRRRFIGANLAQEGIEIIANIRSNNWLAYPNDVNPDNTLRKWRGETSPPCEPGDADCLADGSYLAQYDSLKLSNDSALIDIAAIAGILNDPLTKLSIDSKGHYCHSSLNGCSGIATPSAYSRAMNISTINDHQIKIISTVAWLYNGFPYSVSIEARLYNWK